VTIQTAASSRLPTGVVAGHLAAKSRNDPGRRGCARGGDRCALALISLALDEVDATNVLRRRHRHGRAGVSLFRPATGGSGRVSTETPTPRPGGEGDRQPGSNRRQPGRVLRRETVGKCGQELNGCRFQEPKDAPGRRLKNDRPWDQVGLAIQWLWSFSRLWVAVTNRHSDCAADLPLRMNRSMCRLYLIWPNTGSIVIFRWA